MASALPKMPTDELNQIADKVTQGARLSPQDGLYLLQTPHDESVRSMADFVRQKRFAETVFFASTLYIHPTNLCELSCPMCSFYAKPGMSKAWFSSPAQIEAKIRQQLQVSSFDEVHIVGGLWRDCNLDYYEELFGRIKNIDERLHIKALTPVEYDFLASMHKLSVAEVFQKMQSWGLGSLPGGGAEVLVEHIRKQVAPQKISSQRYLNIHKIAHQQGLPSNITMLFGHVEELEDLVTHFCLVRELQDETHGFKCFIPLRYHEENNALGKRKMRLKPKDIKRIYAAARLMLDNIAHLKVLWNYVGIEQALEILDYGANDFSSTNTAEQIIQMAGGVKEEMTESKILALLQSKERKGVATNSTYQNQNLCLA